MEAAACRADATMPAEWRRGRRWWTDRPPTDGGHARHARQRRRRRRGTCASYRRRWNDSDASVATTVRPRKHRGGERLGHRHRTIQPSIRGFARRRGARPSRRAPSRYARAVRPDCARSDEKAEQDFRVSRRGSTPPASAVASLDSSARSVTAGAATRRAGSASSRAIMTAPVAA